MMEQNKEPNKEQKKKLELKSELLKRFFRQTKQMPHFQRKPKLGCTKEHTNDFSAHYCRECGLYYLEYKEYVEEAYKKTIWYEFENIKEDFETFTGKKLRDNVWVKLLIIVIALLPAILVRMEYGSTFRMMESEQYSVQYNKQVDEYYLFTELDEIIVDLYCPGEVESLASHMMDDDGQILETLEYSLEDPVVLRPMETGYVRLEALYEDGRVDGMNLYVFKQEK